MMLNIELCLVFLSTTCLSLSPQLSIGLMSILFLSAPRIIPLSGYFAFNMCSVLNKWSAILEFDLLLGGE